MDTLSNIIKTSVEPDPSLEKYSILQTDSTVYPYFIIEPALDITQPLMTFLMWSVLFFIFVPAAIFDYIAVQIQNSECMNAHGPEWRAFSMWAATGRNDITGIF